MPEALIPGLDQVRTAGVVTLPGAFIGVLLGVGSPAQAAAAQVLVLLGIMAAQTTTAVVAGRLINAARARPGSVPDARRAATPRGPPPVPASARSARQCAPGLPGVGFAMVNAGDVEVSQSEGSEASPSGLSTRSSSRYSPFFTVLDFSFFSA